MNRLPGLENAAAIILSCPGPLRRQPAALIPMADVRLPQVLLGAESQMLAFAAAATQLHGRLFFAPFPEMFPDSASLRAAWRRTGGSGRGRLAHLRFGSVRAARVLKGVLNACVVAEAGGAAPLTASHHPFASGAVLPAAMERLFVYGTTGRPRRLDGAELPASRLSGACITADLLAGSPSVHDWDDDRAGLDLVSLAEFRSVAWAAGTVRSRTARGLMAAGNDAVLVPWNMDHPGSIVPDLLERLARLHGPGGSPHTRPQPRLVLLPFNYIGQTGIIRHLIGRLRQAAHASEQVLSDIFLARVATCEAIGKLRAIARCAWVDGNDPEHWWTLARFSACGIAPILIDPHDSAQDLGCLRLQADEAVWVEAETRCGKLTFAARLPSLRSLPDLLAMTATSSGVAQPPDRLQRRHRAAASPAHNPMLIP